MVKGSYQHKSECNSQCKEFSSTDCVVYKDSLEYLGLEEGASTTEIIQKLTQTVEFLQTQINELKALHP
jgi:hypothetical protein